MEEPQENDLEVCFSRPKYMLHSSPGLSCQNYGGVSYADCTSLSLNEQSVYEVGSLFIGLVTMLSVLQQRTKYSKK